MSIADKLTGLASVKTAIKDALWAKGQRVNDNMTTYATAIRNLEGDANPVAEDNDVIFVDYDGKIRYSYTREQFLALNSLPPNPVHEGLTAQGWNWDIFTAKSFVTTNHFLCIGQNYITDDGKTRLHLELPTITDCGFPLTIYFNQTAANGVVVDWGDGSTGESVETIGDVSLSHIYRTSGKHILSFAPIDGTFTLGTSNSSRLTVFGSSGNASQQVPSKFGKYLKKIEFGSSLGVNAGLYAFSFLRASNFGTIAISFPTSFVFSTAGNDYQWLRGSVFHAFIVPKNTGNMSTYIPDARFVSMPESGVDYYMNNASLYNFELFPYLTGNRYVTSMSCHGVLKATIPTFVTEISYQFCNSCSILELICAKNTPPSLGASGSFALAPNGRLFVPYGCGQAYMTATNWSDYADQIFELHEDGSRPTEEEIQAIIASRQ